MFFRGGLGTGALFWKSSFSFSFTKLLFTAEPVPTALVDQFLLAIKNDNVELFRSLIEENEVNINAPILDISPVLERTYLLHEIAKNVPTNENLTKYIEGLDENTIDLNKVDAHGRDAHWYETLEHLELSVLQRS